MAPRPRFDRRAPVRELPNINDRINYPKLRVVDADGTQLGVISRDEALDVARERELDLVLVSEKADPPVCRIMDYGKFKFEQEKKAKEAKKKSHQTEVKEVKMRYKIDAHDYQVRIGQAVRFLKAGDKVKCTVIFRGREIQHTALAEKLLMRMAKDLEESAEVQQPPKREGRNMIMFLGPRKTPLQKDKPEQATKAERTLPIAKPYTFNALTPEMTQRGHHTSARFPREQSEFEACGFEPSWQMPIKAPFVAESPLQIGLKLVEHQPLGINGTHLIIGGVESVQFSDDALRDDGSVDLNTLGLVAAVGLDAYHEVAPGQRYAYAKPDRPPELL